MSYRILAFSALVSLAITAACSSNDNNNLAPDNAATVRFVNATGNGNISVANDGTIATGNDSLGFGTGSSCMTVDPANTNLAFTNAPGGKPITGFTPDFAGNGNYTVVAYTDMNGQTQFATLNNQFTPASGDAGLRVFNASANAGNVVLSSNGAALNSGASTAFGTGGAFFNVPAGTSSYLFNTGTGTSTIGTIDNVPLAAGQNTTLIIGPAAPDSSTMRAFVTAGC